jgi:hypothetical protein
MPVGYFQPTTRRAGLPLSASAGRPIWTRLFEAAAYRVRTATREREADSFDPAA